MYANGGIKSSVIVSMPVLQLELKTGKVSGAQDLSNFKFKELQISPHFPSHLDSFNYCLEEPHMAKVY